MAVPQTDSIEATTLQLIRPRMTDNIFKANVIFAWFLMNGRIKTASGGKYISEPLIYASNQTVMAYRGYERLNVAPTEELTDAQYGYRLTAVTVGISGEEELINNGENARFDLLRAKIKVAELSIREFMNIKFLSPVSTKDANRDIIGLDEIYDDTTAWSTFGGINSNTYVFWRNILGTDGTGAAAGAPFTVTGTSAAPVVIPSTNFTDLPTLMNRMYHLCSKGGPDRPDLIVTTKDIYESYERAALDKLRLYDTNLAQLGFESIRFKDAYIVWDESVDLLKPAADTSPLYFINSDYMSFTLHTMRNFKMSAFISPWDQDARVAQILFAGNSTVANRRRLGVVYVRLT